MTFNPTDCSVECDGCGGYSENRVKVYCRKCFNDLVKENERLKKIVIKMSIKSEVRNDE